MEPMDLDEDSLGETPKRVTRSSAAAAAATYAFGTASAPCFSPLGPSQSLWTQQPQLALPPALSSSTPVSRQSSHTDLNYSSPHSVVAKDAVMPFRWNSSMMGFTPVPEAYQRRGTPSVQGLGSRAVSRAGSPDDGIESPNSSGRSDVSDMEVGHCSLSPSWDRVTSALGSINIFRSNSEADHSTAEKQGSDEKQGNGEGEQGTHTMPAGKQSLWEPCLTAVQTAATFKRRRPGRQGSSSNLTATADSQQPATPLRKLGRTGSRQESAEASEGTNSEGPGVLKKVSPDTGGKPTWMRCFKVLAVVILFLAAVCSFLFHRQVADRRERFAKMDTELLRNEMASKLFGQHIAMQVVPGEVQSYLDSFRSNIEACQGDNCTAIQPLVLSFHGWTGVGKNFVSDIISSVFPLKTVTKFLIPYHFPHKQLDDLYSRRVEEWVLSNVTEYAMNFFVFDEMDKAGLGVMQGLINAVTKLNKSRALHSPTVFLLLSNSLGSEINKRLFQSMVEGHPRESVTLDDFSPLFSHCDHGWCGVMSPNVITRAVPFLPLERQHVVQCIRRDLVTKKLSTKADIISRVLNELTFTTLSSGHQFSQTGCKRVADKVDYVTIE